MTVIDCPDQADPTIPERPPLVSVVMIFLNAERYIEEAIDSVLVQDFRDFELILVDDGSEAACSSIARSYAVRYPHIVRYTEHDSHSNRGMSASRNLGIAKSRGEYIALIDADDVWAPEKLTQQVAIMERHDGLGMVCGAVRYWYSWDGRSDVIIPTGHSQNMVIDPPEASLALYPLGTAAAPCPSDLLLRHQVVTAIGGFEEHFTEFRQMYEDQGFLAKLYLSAPVYFSDQVWLSYRQHNNSCVAKVMRDGRYHDVRQYFLTWLEDYLNTRPEAHKKVKAALQRAKWPYDHPILHHAAERSLEWVRIGRSVWWRLKRAAHRQSS